MKLLDLVYSLNESTTSQEVSQIVLEFAVRTKSILTPSSIV